MQSIKNVNLKSKEYLLLILLVIPLIEPLYMSSNTTSGSKNNIVSIYLISILILITYNSLLKNLTNKITVTYLTTLLIFIHFIIIGGDIKETLRYASLIIFVYLVSLVPKLPSLRPLFYGISIVGAYYAFGQKSVGIERATGFLNTSPTLFSYVLLIMIMYLLFYNFNIRDLPMLSLNFYLIYLTESRSTLAVGILILFVPIFLKLQKLIKNKILIFIIFMASIFLFAYIFIYVSNNITLRESGNDSTQTREKYLNSAIEILKDHPEKFLIGGGSGTSYDIVSNVAGIKTPTHFDPLTIFVDYGLFGLLVLLLMPVIFFRKMWFWGGWILLLIGSIHNLLYFPIGLIMVCIISKEIKLNGENKNEKKY